MATDNGTLRANRLGHPGWRDPRLWIGVAIVAASVLLGARLLASADDTVAVWAAADELGPGQMVEEADLVARQVRFADGGDLDRYLRVDAGLPEDLETLRVVGSGELVARSAVGPAAEVDTVQVPLSVADELVPESVNAGSIVDVYLLEPGVDSGESKGDKKNSGSDDEGPVLSEVTVVDAPAIGQTLGASGQRRVVVAVEPDQADEFFVELGSLTDPRITIVRRG